MDPVLFLNGSSVNFSMDTFFTVLDIHTKSIFLMKICEELYKDSCGSCINICIQWFLFYFLWISCCGEMLLVHGSVDTHCIFVDPFVHC
jgi:hypothetical protein